MYMYFLLYYTAKCVYYFMQLLKGRPDIHIDDDQIHSISVLWGDVEVMSYDQFKPIGRETLLKIYQKSDQSQVSLNKFMYVQYTLSLTLYPSLSPPPLPPFPPSSSSSFPSPPPSLPPSLPPLSLSGCISVVLKLAAFI